MHGKRTFRQRRSFLGNSEAPQCESPPELPCEREQQAQPMQPGSNDSEPDTGIEGSSSGASKSKRVGRGVTVAAKTWGRNEPYADVVYNEFGQICNERANDFSTFIGTLSRKSEIVPLTIPDWRYVKPEAKDKIFRLCQEKFGMDDSRKNYMLNKVHDCWRKSKNKLKKRAFEAGTTVAQQVAARPEYIPKEDWATLCHYWKTPEAMTKSEINKANRDGNIMPHTGGRKTIAQWREEKRLPDGTLLERAEMFAFLRRKRNTGEPVNEFARKTLEKAKKLQEKMRVECDLII